MNQTILVTGASSGLGGATATHFQAQGWNVIATMRAPEKKTELTRLERTLVTRLDVEDADSGRPHGSSLAGGYGAPPAH